MQSEWWTSPWMMAIRRGVVEALGTYILVLVGCGAVVVDVQKGGPIGHLGVCLAFGAVVACIIFATGHLSGAHINPAVTIAFAAMRRTPLWEVPGYIVAQCVGAVAACATLATVIGTEAKLGATTPSISVLPGLGVEIGLTAMLMFFIAGVATDDRAQGQLAAIAVGTAVALLALVGGPLTGASMNPARSLGPAMVSGEWTSFWIYIVGPVIGAVLGGLGYQFLAVREPEPDDAS